MKRLFTLFILICFGLPCFAQCSEEQIVGYEHLFPEKKALTNNVMITTHRNVLCKGNFIKINFNCKFKSECAKAGEILEFTTPESIYTQEGTLIIPSGTKFTARIIKIEKQRMPNKNARVHLNFECIEFPDGTTSAITATPATKDGTLKEGPWLTGAKIASYTIGLGCVGAGAGVGFAFIPTVARIGVGLAIGIPVGVGVGLITGVITPGLKYHAKKGEAITISLCDNLALPKMCR